MKLLNMLTISLSDAMSVIAIMSGISNLIFSVVTWKNTEIVKRETKRYHNDLKKIIELTQYKNESKKFLKRLDKDIGILFNDLGRGNERSEIILMKIRKNNNHNKNVSKTEN